MVPEPSFVEKSQFYLITHVHTHAVLLYPYFRTNVFINHSNSLANPLT